MVWDRLLTAHPELRSLVELGTGQGGTSLYLLLQCIQRGMTFDTFDTAPAWACDTPVGKLAMLGQHFHCGSYLDALRPLLERILDNGPHPLLLFCDGGDKPRDFQMFAPLLKVGDLIAVHDFGGEFSEPDTDPVKALVEAIFEVERLQVGSRTGFYRRI